MVYEILDENGNVVNTIVADEAFVEAVYPGRYRLGKQPKDAPTWVITKVAMISRFTPQEYVGIVSATKTDVEVQAWYDLFQAAGNVNLQDQRTRAGINSLATKNLITPERANEILTTPAQDNEKP